MAKLLEKWLSEVPIRRKRLPIANIYIVRVCPFVQFKTLSLYVFMPLQHNSQLPKNYKEKETFRQFLREGIHRHFTATFALIGFEA